MHRFVVKASIYVRWIRWLLRVRMGGEPTVVLNLDETSMLSPVDKRRGLVWEPRSLQREHMKFQH